MPELRCLNHPPVAFLRRKHCESGQSILESLIVMFVLCLMFFGLLQIFHLTVAKMITNYSAATAGRSSSVGFAEYLVDRNGRCAAIAASGRPTYPLSLGATNPVEQYADERVLIHYYTTGESWLEYEYWNGDQENVYNSTSDSDAVRTTHWVNQDRSNPGIVTITSGFNNYPLVMPFRFMLTNSKSTDISSKATFVDFSSVYLEN